jgi:hypothetical protein
MGSPSWLSSHRVLCPVVCSILGCGGSSAIMGFGADDAGDGTAIGTDGTAPQPDGNGGGARNDGGANPVDGAAPTQVDEAGILFINAVDGATLGGCVPGTYVGTFDCTITAILGLIQIPWKGPMSLTLMGQQSASGEFTMLAIAPGAHISGTDQYDGSFSANLSGTLDCATQKLKGALDGTYLLMSGLVNINAMFAGNLAGDYAATATPPAFTNGVMGPLASPQWGGDGGFLGTCTWSAALK